MNDLQTGIAVISHRALEPFIGWEPIYEIEDALVHYCKAVVADAMELKTWLAAKRLKAKLGFQYQIENLVDSATILLVIARHPGDLNVIRSIKHLRRRFGRVFGYVTDSYFHKGYGPIAREFDHLFVTGTEDVGFVTQSLGVSSSVLRQSLDTVRWQSGRADRCIDLIGYGRTPQSYHQALQARFHDPASPFLYLHSPLGSVSGPEIRTERPMFFQTLRRSKLCLAFNMFVEPVGNRPRSMMVTSRWLEALASGCIVVGRRPVGEMADDMLGWPNATFELSSDPSQGVYEILELLNNLPALDNCRRVNLMEVRKRHDVRWRLREMLTVMNLEIPKTLQKDIDSL